MSKPIYIMESQKEAQRLEKKTDYEETLKQLKLVGLKPGMKALDAGAGTGAVARVMAEVVGVEGEVVALDVSADRLAVGQELAKNKALQNIRFITGDLYDPPLQKNHYDFIWCRFVFEYLSDPDLVLGRLKELLAPGGTLVIGDLDGNIVFHDGMAKSLERELLAILESFDSHFDPYAGRKLYGRFYRQGMKDINVHCVPYHLYAGVIPESHISNWQDKLAGIQERAVATLGSQEEYERFCRQFMQFLSDPATFTYSVLFLVSGKK